jgi:hypothetical protein
LNDKGEELTLQEFMDYFQVSKKQKQTFVIADPNLVHQGGFLMMRDGSDGKTFQNKQTAQFNLRIQFSLYNLFYF